MKLESKIFFILQPTFELILQQAGDCRRKGELTIEQRRQIKAYLLEEKRSAVRVRRKSKKRLRR